MMNTSRQIFDVWRHGCSSKPSVSPWECEGCTVDMIEALDKALTRDAAALQRAEDTETANMGLRVNLHMTQQQLAAANASVVVLAQGAGLSKHQHLEEVAKLIAQNGEQLDALEEAMRELTALRESAEGY